MFFKAQKNYANSLLSIVGSTNTEFLTNYAQKEEDKKNHTDCIIKFNALMNRNATGFNSYPFNAQRFELFH